LNGTRGHREDRLGKFPIDRPPIAPFHATADAGLDEIHVADSTWEYIFSSDDPDWDLFFSGELGDAVTPTAHDADGYSIRLFNPVNGERTWIWADYNDRVEWTLRGLVLLDDTTFALTLDEYLNGPTTFFFDVTGVAASVPALSSPALVGTALGILAAAVIPMTAWRRSARTRGSAFLTRSDRIPT